MSPSEIAFLALGLILGAALGAALLRFARARPAPRREVRLTITPNAIPARRSPTLAVAFGAEYPGPIPGSPEDTALVDARNPRPWPPSGQVAPAPSTGGPSRTRVSNDPVALPLTAVAVPVGADPARPVREPSSGPLAPQAVAGTAAVMTAVGVLDVPAGPDLGALPAGPDASPWSRPGRPGRDDAFTTLARPRPPVDNTRPSIHLGAIAVTAAGTPNSASPSVRAEAAAGAPDAPEPVPATADPSAAVEPCADQRRMVDERCALADVTREQARRATEALREAQRAYDVLRDRVERAEATSDPRRVAAEKERLHAVFRTASDRAGSPDETELAAREWLSEVNALNAAVRESLRIVEAGRAELRAQLPALDRLSAESDAARISAENAEVACREAREDLAACEEAEARARASVPPPEVEPHPFAGVWPVDSPNLPDAGAAPDAAGLEGLPLVVRVLRGERQARDRLVATLAAGDQDGEREWVLRISRFVDAIVSRAIEDGYLDLPEDDAFWRLFERREARDIVGALSALGFRYDGMGGFADGRVPAARDLSLAVGYAGLDRMRIRTWPGEADLGRLYERAVVAADEWLADQAGDLSLGRMVDALGGRASDLTDVWNAWGRVRPALLAP